MLFILHCVVQPGQAERLAQFRDQHRAHAQAGLVKIVSAGPTLSDDGERLIGGLYVFEAESREEVEAFYDRDPYVQNGIWKQSLLERWDKRV
jgi:uncharacterized protein YciI